MKISLEKAKTNKLFYFVVTGIIYHSRKKKCLILKRSEKENAHGGLWGVTGGKLEWLDLKNNPVTRKNFAVLDWEDLIEKLIIREAKEESGLEVFDPRYIDNVVYLRPDKVPTVCFKFAVKYKRGKLNLAPEFNDFAWVDYAGSQKYECIKGIPEEIRKTIEIYVK